jgi:hypothetical protein
LGDFDLTPGESHLEGRRSRRTWRAEKGNRARRCASPGAVSGRFWGNPGAGESSCVGRMPRNGLAMLCGQASERMEPFHQAYAVHRGDACTRNGCQNVQKDVCLLRQGVCWFASCGGACRQAGGGGATRPGRQGIVPGKPLPAKWQRSRFQRVKRPTSRQAGFRHYT